MRSAIVREADGVAGGVGGPSRVDAEPLGSSAVPPQGVRGGLGARAGRGRRGARTGRGGSSEGRGGVRAREAEAPRDAGARRCSAV